MPTANWDTLRQGDDKFSRNDLEKVAGNDPAEWANDALKKELAGDGPLKDNWSDKVEYALYLFAIHANNDALNNTSIFRYQEDEWKHFRPPPQGNVGFDNRLDENLHLNYSADGQNSSNGNREAG